MNSHFSFDDMLTPKIVTVLYVIGLGLTVLAGIVSIFQGSVMGVLIGLGTLVFGPIILRLSCETVMVIFKIHENLHELARRDPR
jgi:hypothetical protein